MLQAVHWWLSTYERLVKSQKFFSSYLTQEDESNLGRTGETGILYNIHHPINPENFKGTAHDYHQKDTGL